MGYYEEYYEDVDDIKVEESARVTTETNIRDNVMEFKFDTKSFYKDIVESVRNEVVEKLKEEMLKEIKKEILTDEIKKTLMLSSHKIVKDMIDDYVANEKITVGGNSFWDDEPLKEYSLMEYAKKCIADSIKEGKFNVVIGYEKDRYRDTFCQTTKTFKFDDYIRSELAIGNDIKEYIDGQILEIKNSVNKNVKELFDTSTKQMLSESVLNILMANDTYKKIESGIACIADNVQSKEGDEWN